MKTENRGTSAMRKVLTACFTALLFLALFSYNTYERTVTAHTDSLYNAALIDARRAYLTDLTFRHWNSRMGGIYAEISPQLAPNPYLAVPDRDITTTEGKHLTLINPAYMTRMVQELMAKNNELKGHITSLTPLSPGNAPTEWERAFLESFNSDPTERHSIVFENGAGYLRYMKPMITEPYCLKCHGHQGYKVGDIRGGISITVPLKGYYVDLERFKNAEILRSLAIFAVGALSLLSIFYFMRRHEHLRNHTEQALRKSEARFRTLFANAPLGILLIDSSARILECNAAGRALFQRDWDSMVAAHLHEVLSFPDISPRLEHLFRHNKLALETSCSLPSAPDVAYIRLLGFLIHQGLFVIIIEDQTAHRQDQENLMIAKADAEQASKVKTEFLAVMSHEIRTPLNGVIGMLQLAKLHPLGKELGEYVDIALDSSHNLLRILSDVLDISKIESGKMEFQESPFSFQDIIKPVSALFTDELRKKNLHYTVLIDDSVPETLRGDSGRLRQILYNLIGNAVKYSERGSIQVAVSLLPFSPDPSKRCVHISITDTGIGIPDDKLYMIFEPFTQSENALTRRHGGVGLGLSIVKRLVTLMGGTLSIASDLEHGTEVHLTLLLAPASEPAGAANRLADDAPRKTRSLRLLVVEDEEINRKALLFMLDKLGHVATGTSNGQAALTHLAAEHFDMVLMDIQMPLMNGLEATALIRALPQEDKRRIPIIAITAYAMSGDRERFLKAGMDDYLSKPIDMEALQQCLDRQAALLVAKE